ncbi:MAG: 2-oxo acid dehydrogenase subunit E2, partial [Planctomycetota bacterium]|nr:2-oxo acid dehydrogenase subunit E2 [Planctomycetota bacterium]
DKLSISEIAAGVSDLADRARNKTLKPEEVQGGTFTITNPGGFGTLIGTPIINQPQSGILCFGAVQKRVVVVPGTDSIGVRNMSYLTLTFDHRLIDGAVADQFMESIRRTIETVDCTLDK